MTNINKFPGLSRGPIDHNASHLINAIADGDIDMGDAVKLVTSIKSGEILPRVIRTAPDQGSIVYGIAVAGDRDGIYGDGSTTTDLEDDRFVAARINESVIVCTRGRCLAKVQGGLAEITPGSNLTGGPTAGVLDRANPLDYEVATSLGQVDIDITDIDMIAIDFHKDGERNAS